MTLKKNKPSFTQLEYIEQQIAESERRLAQLQEHKSQLTGESTPVTGETVEALINNALAQVQSRTYLEAVDSAIDALLREKSSLELRKRQLEILEAEDRLEERNLQLRELADQLADLQIQVIAVVKEAFKISRKGSQDWQTVSNLKLALVGFDPYHPPYGLQMIEGSEGNFTIVGQPINIQELQK